ncbi:cytochrome c oxidase assembly protein [Aeromonas caviae]
MRAGQSKLMPLKFYIDPALPDSINTITLSYSLYDITESVPAPALAQRK